MKNLFKEVFRSLFKNKATVAGLTILVFLTSGIFTLLHDTAQSMKLQYNKIKNQSVAHDLTIDLNLSTNAKAYNDGYLINGLTQANALPEAYNKPILYAEDNYKKIFNVIDLRKLDQDFISLSNFVNLEDTKDKYIKRSDFIRMYNQNKSDDEAYTSLKLDYSTPNKTLVLTNNDYIFPLYQKNTDNKFTEYKTEHKLLNTDQIHFDKEYKLNDIAYVTNPSNNEIIASQLPMMFINVNTKEATFNLSKGQNWKKTASVIEVAPSNYAEKLGFNKYQSKDYIFVRDNSLTPTLFQSNDNLNNIQNLIQSKIKLNFEYNDLFKNEYVSSLQPEYFTFKHGTKYNVPLQWAAKQEVVTYYQRKLYQTTYTDYKDKWEGAYVGFMEYLINNNPEGKKIPKNFDNFSYWEKDITGYLYKFNTDGTLSNQSEQVSHQSPVVSKEEVLNKKLMLAPIEQQYGVAQVDKEKLTYLKNSISKSFILVQDFINKNKTDTSLQEVSVKLLEVINKYSVELKGIENPNYDQLKTKYFEFTADIKNLINNYNIKTLKLPDFNMHSGTDIPNYETFRYETPRTIADLEGFNQDTLTYNNYERLVNKNILGQTFNEIKTGALNIVKKNIYEKVKEQVGENNIGIKQQLTIDAFNDKTNEKNVFQFINIGDQDGKINGISNNINKLINEISNPTEINSMSLKIDNYFKTKQLSYDIAAKVLVNSSWNVVPFPEYIKTDYSYDKVIITDYNDANKKQDVIYGRKVFKLANYVENANDNTPESDYNVFNGYGIIGLQIGPNWYLYLLKAIYKENEKDIDFWVNVPLASDETSSSDDSIKRGNGLIEELDVKYFLQDNKWTVKAKLNPNGWVEKSSEYENAVYIPFGYRGPLSEILAQAINQKSMSIAVENMQRALLDTDLIKKGFIQKDVVYAFTEAVKYSFDLNDFASVFASGTINLSAVSKIIIDTLYHMSHNINGDYVNKFLVGIFKKVREEVSQYPTVEERKKYLTDEVQSLFNLLSLMGQNQLSELISPESLVEFSKDPIIFLDSIIDLINSIDFIKFTDDIHEFLQTTYNNEIEEEIIDESGNKRTIIRQQKLSMHQMFIWLFKSIDQDSAKKAIFKLIDNINLNFIQDANNTKNPLYLVLKNMSPIVTGLINRINNKNDGQSDFQNVLNGVKKFVQMFDLQIFAKALESKLKLEKFNQTTAIYSFILNDFTKYSSYYSAASLSNIDYIYALLNAFFSVPGSDNEFKQNIIDMLNLSSKGQSIAITDGKYLTIPAPDSDKLDYFYFLGMQNSQENKSNRENRDTFKLESNENVVKFNTDNTFLNVYNFLITFKQWIDNNVINEINYSKLPQELQNLAKDIFGINRTNQTIPLDKANEIVNDMLEAFDMLKASGINPLLNSSTSLSDLIIWYKNVEFNPRNQTYTLLRKVLEKFITPTKLESNVFNAMKEGFGVYKFWLKIFNDNSDVSFEERINFANNLLALANNKQVLDSFNSFELFQPAAENIIGYETTGFGITRSIANLFAMKNEFFTTDQEGNYLNPLLAQFVQDNIKFKDWIKNNEINITRAFSYIGTSDLYMKVNLPANTKDNSNVTEGDRQKLISPFYNADSVVIYYLINGVLANDKVQKYYPYISYLIDSQFNTQNSLVAAGVPDIIFSNLLIINHPELLIWYLTDTNKVGELGKNNANLAYLVSNKLINYEYLIKEKPDYIYQLLQASIKTSVVNPVFEKEKEVSLALDDDLFYKWINEMKNNPDVSYKPFGVDIIDVILKSIDTITGTNKMTNIIKYDQIGSYIAKVNYAWLLRNNKKIYSGKLPKKPDEMVELLDKLPEDYKINVNGSEYIIIGEDLTYDNIYPVLDEANLQLDPKSQAIVYVNSQGFDRIKQAYRGNVVKEYLLVKNSTDKNNIQLKADLDKIIKQETVAKDDFQRVFLDDELDMLNPERSIRITAMKGIVKSVDYSSKILLSILVTLVAISIIFIIKRYISNKNKVIGILVAQGYTPIEIALSMTVFAFFTIFIGDVIGYLTGFLLQGVGIKILDNYWTVPIETLNFSWVSLVVNIVIPLLAMSILIIVVSLRSLRFKSIDLMSGIVEVATGETYKKYAQGFSKRSVKTKFSASLIFNSFWKLSSFGISIILTSLTTLFGFATFGVFEESIQKTYQNRNYNYRFDLYSPTLEGGAINPYESSKLENNLYVPIGDISEIDQYKAGYFKPGVSTAVNENGKNGNPNEFDGHVISQFSINITIDSVVGIDPWNAVYNSLPDSQKSRIIKVRDIVGKALEQTQSQVVFDKDGNVDVDKTTLNGVEGFFQYYPNKDVPMNGKFFYMKLDNSRTTYDIVLINTSKYRDEYRQFLVNGYKKIAQNNDELLKKNPKAETINDFFISFGGLYFNPQWDEVYSYVDANITSIKGWASKEKANNLNVRLYGYLPNSKQVKIIASNGQDLLKKINDEYDQNPNAEAIPLIINEVVSQSYGLKVGQSIEIKPNNTVDRYKNVLDEEINQTSGEKLKDKIYKFVIRGINPSYINNEFIIPKNAADNILGLTQLTYNPAYQNGVPFNGVLSNNPLPMQILNSASLYSMSGYWPSVDSFDTESLTDKSIGELFDGIFGSTTTVANSKINGAMRNIGYSDEEIAKFFNPQYSGSSDVNALQESYKVAKAEATKYIEKFARIFENKLYVPSAASIDSKDIEINFTMTIAKTVQIVVSIISILTFIVSIVILVIISTILINENEKNIAIWAVLGYSEKEKLRIFFSIYIPFILFSILISLPIAYGLISIFSSFLTSAAHIAIPLAITAANAFLTIGVILLVFILTASLAWFAINKVKAIDLLKGK
ncbi:ABC transporter permease [Mycoplasmopsis verecunda]|nr:ABC transporter permease [Mycoplasmopsis verecunda]WPB54536.1 ABC transporter permease [Mycoplasmopsis verecunda]